MSNSSYSDIHFLLGDPDTLERIHVRDEPAKRFSWRCGCSAVKVPRNPQYELRLCHEHVAAERLARANR